MCGIAGFIAASGKRGRGDMESVARAMATALRHRGPDDEGVWSDEAAGVAFGFRRLSILDLSQAGHQPMVSHDGRHVIVFNGEIYNHHEIRKELEAAGVGGWRGHSDTETMLEAIARWGVEAALRKFNGMFAFAVWDMRDRVLSLARDRMGEKPLYYGWAGNTFLFGSELKALRAHPDFRGEIDRGVVALFLRHSCVPDPYSIYRGIWKLPPASWLTVKNPTTGSLPEPRAYWSFEEAFQRGCVEPFEGSEEEGADLLDRELRRAVKMRMEADVPLGAFLSGGIDSSLITALMQAQSPRPVKTFSIGFHETAYNEAEYAKAVARHLGTEHTEMYVTSDDAMAVVPKLPLLYDEPFSDPSEIPTFLVSGMARRHVTVSLSGDAGDELFGGYTRYLWGKRVWGAVGWMPWAMRRGLSRALVLALGCAGGDGAVGSGSSVGWLRRLQQMNLATKAHKLTEILLFETPQAFYQGMVSHWKKPSSLVIGGAEPITRFTSGDFGPGCGGFVERMMFLDTVTYLPDDILVKVDRASMGVGLESRAPLLDHLLVEQVCRFPAAMKLRGGETKRLLRRVLDRYVPRALIDRPKMGFGVPVGAWMRGPLRAWAEDLISEERLKREGFLNPTPIREKWDEHLAGRRDWQYHLWDVLMFQNWLAATR